MRGIRTCTVSRNPQNNAERLVLPLIFYRWSNRLRERSLPVDIELGGSVRLQSKCSSYKTALLLWQRHQFWRNNDYNSLISSLVWRVCGYAGRVFKRLRLGVELYTPSIFTCKLYYIMNLAVSKSILSWNSIILRLRKWVPKSNCMSS